MKKKAMIGAVFAIVALILLSLTFVTPWYYFDLEMEVEGQESTIESRNYFDEAEVTTQIADGDEETETEEYDEDDESTSVFHNTRILIIVAIIGTALGIAGAFVVSLGKLSPKIGSLLILVGLIFALIAPVYMMIELPDAIEEDMEDDIGPGFEFMESLGESFFGSESGTTTTEFGATVEYDSSWGGTTAWFLSLAAAAVNLIALSLVITTRPGPEIMGHQGYRQQQPVQREPRSSQQYQGPEKQSQVHQQERQPRQQGQADAPQQQSHPCPDCGRPIRYIQEYDSWYCDTCQEYK